MSLVDHARRELHLCGQTTEDPGYAASIVAAVAAFASYGHSGGSQSVAVEQLHTLLNHGTLSPLTADPDEWLDRTEMSGYPMWQSARNPAAISETGGRTYYLLDEATVDGACVMHDSAPARQPAQPAATDVGADPVLVDEQEPFDKGGELVGADVDQADAALDEEPGGPVPWRPQGQA